MRVGWLADSGNEDGTLGGAELTQQEFRNAAPAGVEVIECPPSGVVEGLDTYVIHNCVSYELADLRPLEGTPTVKFWHDVGPWVSVDVNMWLGDHATPICCSPLQAHHMGFNGIATVPPPIDLTRFREAAERSGERRGAVALGPWMNFDKGASRAKEVAPDVAFYGGGPCAPFGSVQVAYDAVPEILAKYATFVHLPTAIEPFGRTVVEAYAAGCKVITNNLVGARYWIEKEPDKLDTAAADFWELVLAA